MRASAFSIHLEFVTPVILGKRSNLDGILARLQYEENLRHGMDELVARQHAHANIPLVNRNGVAAGSSALIPEVAKTHSVTMIGSLTGHLRAMARPQDVIQQKERGLPFEGLPPNLINIYTAFDIGDGLGVWYLGHGDRDKVAALLSTVESLGAKRSIGYGRLKRQPKIADLPTRTLSGMIAADGTVLRPIPQVIADGFKVKPKHFDQKFETFQPPYWQGETVLCYVPPRRTWNMDAISEFLEG